MLQCLALKSSNKYINEALRKPEHSTQSSVCMIHQADGNWEIKEIRLVAHVEQSVLGVSREAARATFLGTTPTAANFRLGCARQEIHVCGRGFTKGRRSLRIGDVQMCREGGRPNKSAQ